MERDREEQQTNTDKLRNKQNDKERGRGTSLTRPTQVRTPFSRTKDVRSFDDN